MKRAKSVIAPAVAALLAAAPLASAAQQAEQDSVYKWGRWAVLSPAAGSAEPYQAASTPGAEFNARPGDAQPFQPTLAGFGPVLTPPGVVSNPPGSPPPTGDPRDSLLGQPVVSPSPGTQPPAGDPRGGL